MEDLLAEFENDSDLCPYAGKEVVLAKFESVSEINRKLRPFGYGDD